MARIAILVLSLSVIILPGPAMAWDGLEISDLRGTWVLEMSTLDGEALPGREIEITSYDDTTGEYSGTSTRDGDIVLTLSGIRADEQTSLRIDDVAGGSWWEVRGVFHFDPRLTISGGYTADRENLGDGSIDGIFEMRLKKAAAVEPASTAPAAPDTASTITPPATDALAPACDLSRIEAAKAFLEADTPYAYTLAMTTYRGRADELSFDLLVSERVQDPTTWDRVTSIPNEDGWTTFETRRIGEEVWQRIDDGAWTAEPPDEDVLGTPWPLDIIGRQLLPGGQAEDPAIVSGWAGQECMISLLFRTEDGGKGEGRTARLVFSADEVLPRSIEFERTLAPTTTSKKTRVASRPGDVYSLITTIRPGDVEAVVPPEETDAPS